MDFEFLPKTAMVFFAFVLKFRPLAMSSSSEFLCSLSLEY